MQDLGLAYWAITDHSKASFQANGLDAAKVRQQIAEVRELQQKARAGKGFVSIVERVRGGHSDGWDIGF